MSRGIAYASIKPFHACRAGPNTVAISTSIGYYVVSSALVTLEYVARSRQSAVNRAGRCG